MVVGTVVGARGAVVGRVTVVEVPGVVEVVDPDPDTVVVEREVLVDGFRLVNGYPALRTFVPASVSG